MKNRNTWKIWDPYLLKWAKERLFTILINYLIIQLAPNWCTLEFFMYFGDRSSWIQLICWFNFHSISFGSRETIVIKSVLERERERRRRDLSQLISSSLNSLIFIMLPFQNGLSYGSKILHARTSTYEIDV